jgi:Protein of unknown function (DUF4256)
MNAKQQQQLLGVLKARFEANPHRHVGLAWSGVQARIESKPDALATLLEMEASGGEPDVIGQFNTTGHVVFCDCSVESPEGRRSLCYDGEALQARKENKPKGSAVELSRRIGIELLTEAQYRALQEVGEFDVKTSSWIKTPSDVRALGGALFCDKRYGKVFVYHNGVQSYYASRGFRGSFQV